MDGRAEQLVSTGLGVVIEHEDVKRMPPREPLDQPEQNRNDAFTAAAIDAARYDQRNLHSVDDDRRNHADLVRWQAPGVAAGQATVIEFAAQCQVRRHRVVEAASALQQQRSRRNGDAECRSASDCRADQYWTNSLNGPIVAAARGPAASA